MAYVDGEPAGWCGVGPRAGFARLTASTAVRRAGLPDPVLYNAPVSVFVAAGFRETGRSSPSRPVLSRRLDPR